MSVESNARGALIAHNERHGGELRYRAVVLVNGRLHELGRRRETSERAERDAREFAKRVQGLGGAVSGAAVVEVRRGRDWVGEPRTVDIESEE